MATVQGLYNPQNKISERSLEFNILSEIIEILRKQVNKVYIVGYTTRQEAHHGIDVSINVPGRVLFAYQFKAPKSGTRNIYRFSIGDRCWICSNPRVRRQDVDPIARALGIPSRCINQHAILYYNAFILKNYFNIDTYYVFPLIRDYYELEQRIPGITRYAVRIHVLDMPVSILLDCNSHKVIIELQSENPVQVSVNILSKPIRLPEDKYKTLDEEINNILKKDIKNIIRNHKNIDRISIKKDDAAHMLREYILRRAVEEGVEKELMERIQPLVKALTSVKFSYRGSAISINA